MSDYKRAVATVYEQLNKSVILGLTGRTGSGCTTTANILETEDFADLDLATPKKKDFTGVEERKQAIIYKYMQSEWKAFTTIEVSSVILSFVFEHTFEEFKEYIEKICTGNNEKNFHIGGYDELKQKMEGLSSFFDVKMLVDEKEESKIDETKKEEKVALEKKRKKAQYDYFIRTIKTHKRTFSQLFSQYSCYESAKSTFEKSREHKSQLYTYLLQLFGNNIRSSGNPFQSDFTESHFNDVTHRVSQIIDIIEEYNDGGSRICIDAIRNPYEAYYLRDKYREFYLVSVNTEDKDRIIRLKNLDQEQLESLDSMEYPTDYEAGRIFYQQSIKECLQISDIHLYNPTTTNQTYEKLTTDLVRYVTLMLHPGLITPTSIERCMQVAFNAKLNSGCLSRQVGAAITDEQFYIKAIGWNEVPQGQVSCGLRSLENYFSDRDDNTFSQFELDNQPFKRALKNVHLKYKKTIIANQEENGISSDINVDKYNLSYCFKDIFNAIKNDKNQVYTRSLHAEENAFLQASKFGGQGIKGGNLFVTASPCELCSKKAYQLGIKNIYYIDPYPGIAAAHILSLDHKTTNPKMNIFYGAIGNAYVSLYSQRFAVKDELQLLTGVNQKKVAVNEPKKYSEIYEEKEFESIDLELKFKSRSDVEFIQKATVIPKRKSIKELTKTLNWTGSSYCKTEKIEPKAQEKEEIEIISYSVKDCEKGNGKYEITIYPEKEILPGQTFNYDLKTSVRDDQRIVNPMLSHHVKYKTKKMHLKVMFNKKALLNESIEATGFKFVLYADMNNNIKYSTTDIATNDIKNTTDPDGQEYYYVEQFVNNPYLLYSYVIEWKFTKKGNNKQADEDNKQEDKKNQQGDENNI